MLRKLADRGVCSRDGFHIYDSTTEQCTCWMAVYSGERNKCKHGMGSELVAKELRAAELSVALETAAVNSIRDFAAHITAREQRLPKALQDLLVISSNAFSVYNHVSGLAKAAEVARQIDVETTAVLDSLRSEDLGDILAEGTLWSPFF